MSPSKLLYIDKNGVSVTKYTLKVKNQSYLLKEITSHKLSTLQPKRIPQTIAIIIGIGLMMSSAIPEVAVPNYKMAGIFISLSAITLYFGALLMFIGVLKIMVNRKYYALQIVTGQGVRNAIVSKKREYIDKILHTMNTASGRNYYLEVIGICPLS